MARERRRFQRSDIFLIVEFRSLKKSPDYSLGITRNFSHDGFSFESHNCHLHTGEILDFRLKHPQRDVAISALGEIVWENGVSYSRTIGIKLWVMDQKSKSKLLELITAYKDQPWESFYYENNSETMVMNEKEDTSLAAANSSKRGILMRDSDQKRSKDISGYCEQSGTEGPSVMDSDSRVSVNESVEASVASEGFPSANEMHDRMYHLKVNGPQNDKLLLDKGQSASVITSATMNQQRKKSQSNIPLVAMFALVAVATLSITFEEVENGLTTFIPNTKSILSQDAENKHVMTFLDNAPPDGTAVEESFEPSQTQNTQEITQKSPREVKKDHVGEAIDALVINEEASGEQPLMVAHNAQPNSVVTRGKEHLPALHLKRIIAFDNNSDVIKPRFYPEIDKIVDALRNNSETIVNVDFFVGSESYSNDLSIRRATAVKNVLVRKGIATSRIEIMGFGETQGLYFPVTLRVIKKEAKELK